MRHALPVAAALLLGAASLVGSPARIAAQPPEPAPVCGQRGRVFFDKDTTLADASGHAIAHFSGGESAVTLLAPPGAGSDVAHIETGTGRGSFRLNGYVKAADLRIFTAAALPVVSGHVWLAEGTRVTAAGASGGKVRVEKQLTTPFNQRFTTTADCSALTFTPTTPAGFAMPGSARVFLMKGTLLDLYGQVPPTGAPVTTLQRASSVDNIRFFSTEQRGGFVHVQYRGEVNIDGWAKAADLSALPRGETSDLPPNSYTFSTAPQLQLAQPPRTVKASRELPLRLGARDAESAIGIIEADTEVYVMDTVAGWANVLPKSLHVLPPGERSFWVKSAELGLP